MLSSNSQAAAEYSKIGMQTGVTAASPVKLICMLYDGAISSCLAAIRAIDAKDYALKSKHLSKAISIVQSGLQESLNGEKGGEISINLDSLYVYIIGQLYKANEMNDSEYVHDSIKLLRDLRSTWEEIDTKDLANA